MNAHRGDERTDRWRRRPLAGLVVRTLVVLVPLLASIASIAVLSRLVPRPHGGWQVLWYGAICVLSWAVLVVAQRPVSRLLPLAVLLEIALAFPDHAPSRAQLARRAGSTRELHQLMHAPQGTHPETVQEAAERVLTLVGALARHDRKTRGHAERVRALTDLIAERMGLIEHNRDRLRWAALLHDIGKLKIPADLLNKDGRPDAREWDVIKGHPEHGARIAAPLMHWLDGWGDVIVQHHERWDGTGYPHGLAGTKICLGARIVSVADAYDVMTSNRAYKKPIGRAAALRELAKCSGSQFDPDVVRAMLATPGRRLVAAMGPVSWVSGIPLLGQGSAVASTAAAQAGAALGAAAVAGAAVFTPLPLAPHPAPRPLTSSSPTPSATAQPAGTSPAPAATGTKAAAVGKPKPKPTPSRHASGPKAATPRRPKASPSKTSGPPSPAPTPVPTHTGPTPPPHPAQRGATH